MEYPLFSDIKTIINMTRYLEFVLHGCDEIVIIILIAFSKIWYKSKSMNTQTWRIIIHSINSLQEVKAIIEMIEAKMPIYFLTFKVEITAQKYLPRRN